MLDLAPDFFRSVTYLQDLTLDCVKFTPTTNSSYTTETLMSSMLPKIVFSKGNVAVLSEFPTWHLKISRVDLSVLSPDTFPENSLRSLTLTSNNLHEIKDNSFKLYHNLERLTISNNSFIWDTKRFTALKIWSILTCPTMPSLH